MSLTGYPPQDLLLRKDFYKKVEKYKKRLINLTKKKKTIFALNVPEINSKKTINSLQLYQNGELIYNYQKIELPNYGVFDEKRYFTSHNSQQDIFKFKNLKIKFLICEDMWAENYFIKSNMNLDLIIIINASPYEVNKFSLREKIASKKAKYSGAKLIYLNLVGSQDELIFDGGSFFMNQLGEITEQISFFKNEERFINIFEKQLPRKNKTIDKSEHLYRALMLAIKNYFNKNNFRSLSIGLSGGIDSALCLTILCDTFRTEDIFPYFLPTIYTSKKSRIDANNLSKNLGIKTKEISIEKLRKDVLSKLTPYFENLKEDVTEENVQSRLRGLLLMALSNKKKSLLVTTGNISELAVGYSTLYGDMCGGFSLLKDVYKTKVFELCEWRNKNILEEFNVKKLNVIPNEIITKEPTAELKFNQIDKDSLPAYNVLDGILELLIDEKRELEFIAKKGYSINLVRRVWKMIINSEFKRFQSAIGPKISGESLSGDRRFPITNKFEL